jgi:septal ring factor EnvC (AmiA/AmiB activator)
MATTRRKRATTTTTRDQIVKKLERQERRVKKLESEGRWVRETLSRIADSIASVSGRLTVMSQRFESMESDLRSISRACTQCPSVHHAS